MPWGRLKEAREAKGLTVEEAADRLKISKKYLLLLERGDLAGLPEPVFVKGYIKNYARFLGVDPDLFLERYNEYLEEVAFEYQPRMDHIPDIPGKRKISRRTLTSIAVALIVVVGVVLVVTQVRREKRLMKVRSQVEADLARETALPPKTGKSKSREPEMSPPKADEVGTVAMQGKEEKASRPPEEKKIPYKEEVKKEVLTLVLEAKELTWVYIVPDGKEPKDVTLYPGDRIEVRAREDIYVKVGNGAGVLARLNGVELGFMGNPGEVVERRFVVEEKR